MEDRKGVDVGEREGGDGLGPGEGGEPVIRISYMRRESVFNKGEK